MKMLLNSLKKLHQLIFPNWFYCFIIFTTNCLTGTSQSITSDTTFLKKTQAYSIGLSTGTAGLIGIDVHYSATKKIGLTAYFNHFDLSFNDLSISASNFGFSDENLLLNSDLNLSTVGFNLDFAPFKKKGFRLIGGLGIGLNNKIVANIGFQEEMLLNDFVISPERIGTFTVEYQSSNTLLPYFGIGIGRAIPKKRVGFSVELGSYFRGAPQINIVSDGLLSNNAHNGPILSENLSQIQWHPKLAFRLAVRLGSAQKTDKEEAIKKEPAPATTKEEIIIPENNPGEPQVELSQYVTLTGNVIATDTGRPVDHLYLKAYFIDNQGNETLERASRYLDGTFSFGLKRGNTYKLILENINYQTIETQITLNDQTPANLEKSFSFSPK